MNCDLIAALNEIYLFGINFAAENNSGLDDKGNFCLIMISKYFL